MLFQFFILSVEHKRTYFAKCIRVFFFVHIIMSMGSTLDKIECVLYFILFHVAKHFIDYYLDLSYKLFEYISIHLLRSELEELEDSGMAELLCIHEKITDLTVATADNSGKGAEPRHVERDMNKAQGPVRETSVVTESL